MSDKGGTSELHSHWENTIYIVLEKKDNLRPYKIKPENSKKSYTKRFHRNIILPCNLLPSTSKKNNSTNRKGQNIKIQKQKLTEIL